MKRFCLLMCFATASCSSGGGVDSMHAFYEVPIGATKPELVSLVGEPFSVKENSDGTVEYEYIERLHEGDRTLEERRYVITMKDGRVVSKTIKQTSPPGYLFDSYQMQTTDNQENF